MCVGGELEKYRKIWICLLLLCERFKKERAGSKLQRRRTNVPIHLKKREGGQTFHM